MRPAGRCRLALPATGSDPVGVATRHVLRRALVVATRQVCLGSRRSPCRGPCGIVVGQWTDHPMGTGPRDPLLTAHAAAVLPAFGGVRATAPMALTGVGCPPTGLLFRGDAGHGNTGSHRRKQHQGDPGSPAGTSEQKREWPAHANYRVGRSKPTARSSSVVSLCAPRSVAVKRRSSPPHKARSGSRQDRCCYCPFVFRPREYEESNASAARSNARREDRASFRSLVRCASGGGCVTGEGSRSYHGQRGSGK